METTPSFGSVLSELEYHDYVALLCSTDAEWSRRRPPADGPEGYGFQPFHEAHERFTKDCLDYRVGVDGNYRAFLKANQGNDAKADDPNHRLRPYLFNPICFFPFGHADNQAIVLLDDFDPVHYLTEVAKTTVEEVGLAFCPKLSSIGVKNNSKTFAELHSLLLQPEAREPYEDSKRPGIWHPPEHAFQEETPLLAFTRFKLDGLGVVGHGLMFQHAVFRAMVDRILRVRDRLHKALRSDGTVGGLIWSEDIDTAQVVFLDLQGPEEIGTLIFCRNYSVALAYIVGVRGLTFADVFQTEPKLFRLLNESRAHRAVVRWSQQLRNAIEPVPGAQLLRDNHVFRWTDTSLAVSRSADADPHHANCHGYVEAISEFQLYPGHRANVEDKIISGREGSDAVAGLAKIEPGYHRWTVGTGDLVVAYSEDERGGRDAGQRLVSVSSLLSLVGSNLRAFGHRKPEEEPGRHVVDISTSLTIPLPRVPSNAREGSEDLLCGRVRPKHFAPLGEVLPELERRLCLTKSSAANRAPGTPQPSRLSLDDLKQGVKKLGIPAALRRTIRYMYQDFATAIGDPFLFDSVIDLYDVFEALHHVLTEYLGPVRAKELNRSTQTWLGPIDEGRAEQLAMLVDASHNALMHRVLRAYPDAPIRDIAIDFRGGLNQLLMAADAPVKCGLGILRKYVVPYTGVDERLVGAITKVGFLPGASCFSLDLADSSFPRLSYFEVDVPHVVHAASYCDYLHESLHLVFDTIRQGCSRNETDPDVKRAFGVTGPVMPDRVSEIFAGLLGHIFVFGGDTKAYLYHHLCSYARSLTSHGTDDRDTLARLVELLLRHFLITDAIPDASGESMCWEPTYRAKDDSPEAALGRFEEMVDQVGFMLRHYDDFWRGPNEEGVRSYCRNQFKAAFRELRPLMPILWREAVGVFRRFADRELRVDGRSNFDMEDIDRDIASAFNRGRPLIRCLYSRDAVSGEPIGDGGTPEAEGRGLDALTLICRLLYRYLSRLREAEGERVHLRRDNGGCVWYARGEAKWHEFQIEPGAAAMFCPVPEARRERLRKQIVIMKTCWDIASNLRSRRLWRMIRDNWADCALYIGD